MTTAVANLTPLEQRGIRMNKEREPEESQPGDDDQSSMQLIRRMQEAETSTVWNAFFHRYNGFVRGFAQKMGLRPDEQSEVVQETMIAAARNLRAAGMTPAKLKAWLRTVSRNKVTDLLRRKYRHDHKMDPLPDTDLPQEEAGPGNEDAEWQLGLVQQAMTNLRKTASVKMFQSFDLFVIREKDADEVAKALGIPRAQVYVNKLRFADKLRKEVNRLGKGML